MLRTNGMRWAVATVTALFALVANSPPAMGSERPAGPIATPGWAVERVWSKANDDWEPALATDPSSDFVYQLTTRIGGPKACKKCADPAIVLRVSPDGGRTWGEDRFLCRCRGLPQGQYDPQIEVAGDGTVFAAWLSGFRPGVMFSRSSDHGATWSAPVPIFSGWSDKPALAVSADGQDVYIAFNGATQGDSYVGQSHDEGVTWTATRLSNQDRYFFAGGGFVAPDGTVTFAENNFNQDYSGKVWTLAVTSHDWGATWTAVRLDVTRRQPDCTSKGCYDGYYGTVPAIAGDANGDLVLVYVGADVSRGRQRVYVRRSTDGGLTWSERTRLSPLDANAVSPAAVGGGPGDVRLWFMDDRTGEWNVWFRSSTDGGLTWSAPARLSNATAGTPYKSRRGFPEVYGDYGEIAITGSGRTVATWGEAPSYHGPGGTWFNRTLGPDGPGLVSRHGRV